jgi:hypothetical protein
MFYLEKTGSVPVSVLRLGLALGASRAPELLPSCFQAAAKLPPTPKSHTPEDPRTQEAKETTTCQKNNTTRDNSELQSSAIIKHKQNHPAPCIKHNKKHRHRSASDCDNTASDSSLRHSRFIHEHHSCCAGCSQTTRSSISHRKTLVPVFMSQSD